MVKNRAAKGQRTIQQPIRWTERYDPVTIYVDKGDGEKISAFATSKGLARSSWIRGLIYEAMRHG